jgi:4-aminobutyrate aminotransferase/(S)-3-amino-2-methylpropionate transaminase
MVLIMGTINLKTKIPGPKSIEWMEARRKYVCRGPFHSTPIFVDHAKGSSFVDVDGNTFLDFSCGIGVTNFGHCPDEIVNAIKTQADRYLHTSFNIVPYPEYVEVSRLLAEAAPGNYEKKTLLVNTGAEAVENAIKIAKSYTKRNSVVCFDHAYHGRTYMAMTLTAKTKPYKHSFGAMNSDVYRFPFPYEYRWNSNGDVSEECFKIFTDNLVSQISPDAVAAVILEPVQGEGGFIVTPKKFMQKLREFCSQHGIVLICDEVQTGFGRTGKVFASEHYGIAPDLITSAKGLAGGLPIAAVVGRAEMMDAPMDGGLGGTFSGNPLSCVAALEVFKMIKKGDVLKNTEMITSVLESYLNNFKDKYSCVGDVRGLGPMRAIELVKDKASKEPNKEMTGAITKECYENGLVVLSAGTYGNVLRLLVPLTISKSDLDEGMAILEKAIAKFDK